MDQAMESISVRDLTPGKNVRQIQVRLIQSWENWNQANEMYEIGLLFSDNQGHIIEGCISKYRVHIFKGKLKENAIYSVERFMLTGQKTKHRVTNHLHRIKLAKNTKFVEVFPPPQDFPPYKYQIKSFDELESRTGDNTYVSDVIGMAVQQTDVIPSKTNQDPRRQIRIKDNKVCAYPVQIVDPAEATSQLANMLTVSKGMRIHLSTPTKIIVSFPYHKEALRAVHLAGQHEILMIQDCPYQFISADEIAHVKSITTDQRVYITLRELPLHLWTSNVVEQILSPYCSLEYVTPEARMMEDLSGYTCIAWSQRTLEIPDEITVMIPQNLSPESHAPQISTTSALLYKYTVFMDKYEYLHGISSTYEYNSAPRARRTPRLIP